LGAKVVFILHVNKYIRIVCASRHYYIFSNILFPRTAKPILQVMPIRWHWRHSCL